MTEVNFYDEVDDSLLEFAVIISKSNGKWVFCKHKERDTFEVPGGHRETGEKIEDTAVRELKEETGYSAKNIKLIHKFFTSAGFSNQKIYIFLATGLSKGEPEFDEDEIIEKYEIDINEARNMVINNEIEDAKTAIGILLAKELI